MWDINWAAKALVVLGIFISFAGYRWIAGERAGLALGVVVVGTALFLGGLWWDYRS